MTRKPLHDPLEEQVAQALDLAGIRFVTGEGGGNPTGLDFYLPAADLHIEVKQMHSERIAGQMARAPNVIAVQGAAAVAWLAEMLDRRSWGSTYRDEDEQVPY